MRSLKEMKNKKKKGRETSMKETTIVERQQEGKKKVKKQNMTLELKILKGEENCVITIIILTL